MAMLQRQPRDTGTIDHVFSVMSQFMIVDLTGLSVQVTGSPVLLNSSKIRMTASLLVLLRVLSQSRSIQLASSMDTILAGSYPDMAYNNTYGFEAINEAEYLSAKANVTTCEALIQECQGQAAIYDPYNFGNTTSVNTLCAEAYGYCAPYVEYISTFFPATTHSTSVTRPQTLHPPNTSSDISTRPGPNPHSAFPSTSPSKIWSSTTM